MKESINIDALQVKNDEEGDKKDSSYVERNQKREIILFAFQSMRQEVTRGSKIKAQRGSNILNEQK